MEPTPIRDNGPYDLPSQARAQFDATTYGIPCDIETGIALVLREALLLTGVNPSTFEDSELTHLSRLLLPVDAQVIAGWIVRAHLSGVVVASSEGTGTSEG